MIPDRSHISTEQVNAASLKLDEMPIAQAVALMNAEDRLMVDAVGKQQAQIAAAVELVARAGRWWPADLRRRRHQWPAGRAGCQRMSANVLQ